MSMNPTEKEMNFNHIEIPNDKRRGAPKTFLFHERFVKN